MSRRYRPLPAVAKGIPRRTALARLSRWALAIPALLAAPDGLFAATPDPTAPPRLPRDQLLLYRTASGTPRPARTRAQWRRRLAEIRQGFESVAGRLPGRERRAPLDPRTLDETDCGPFVRREISYQVEPGQRINAYLLLPKSASRHHPAPAALCLHQTHPAGRKVVVGLGNSPDDEYAVELARRGFVCLAPPYPQLADYQPDLARLGWPSGTLKAVWDNQRGLDLLDSLPVVRRGRCAAIGHSLGGHNAIFTAFLEPRIRVVVTSCAFDSFVDYMGGDIRGWTQDRYLPRLKAYLGRAADIPFDFHELIAGLAPRPFFASAPLGDTNFHWESVDRIAAAAKPVYGLYHAAAQLVVRHPDGPHRFPPALREEAYRFVEDALRHA